MKLIKWGIILISVALFLTACGQGNTNSNEHHNNEEVTQNEETTGANANNEIENNMNENNEEEIVADDPIAREENNADETNEQELQQEELPIIDSLSLYFADNELMSTYRVDTNVSLPMDEASALKAYELWLLGPDVENLVSLLPETTKVQSVQFKDDVLHVSFSSDILDANLGSTGELMVTEQIALIASQFGFDKTQILIDGEVVESFLGHMTIDEPIEAPNPNDYETFN